jgi:hypothetical protein
LGGPANLLLKAGLGHFSWTNWESAYLAKWIKKAASARIPVGYARETPPTLLPIQTESGWLTDTSFVASNFGAASYANYSGVKEKAFWHFDLEMADLWVPMHQGQFSKTPQLGQYNNSTLANCQNPPWQMCSPGLVITDYLSPLNPQGVTNAGLPVRYGVYNGPFRNEPTNLVSLDPTLVDETNNGWVVAIQEGNATHQGWEAAVKLKVDKKTSGQNQTLSATPVPDVMDTNPAIPLTVSSTSSLPVVARIKSGPAEIIGNQIVLKPFSGDSGAKATVIVRYGQAGNSTFQTAALLTDTFIVTKSTPLPVSVRSVSKGIKEGEFYPNPGKSVIFWKGSQVPDQVKICDMRGRVIQKANREEITAGIQTSKIPDGTYVIHFSVNGKSGSRIWVKN